MHIFFRALREIKTKDNNYRAALLCASWGAHRSTVMRLIESYGITDMLKLYEDADFQQVNKLLNQSKVNILLSLKEGSNRSLFESMFANTPVIALKNNVGINKSYINDETGMLIHDSDLAQTLLYFKQEYKSYNPRSWAEKHISPEVTTKKLLVALNKDDSNNQAEKNIVHVKVNNPEVSYLTESLGLSDRTKMITYNFSLISMFNKDKVNNQSDINDFLYRNPIE